MVLILMPFDPERFAIKTTSKSAAFLLGSLGPLAGFMLNDESLRMAGDSFGRPPLPRKIGCCWPLIAVRTKNWTENLLPAFVLPVQWQLSGAHDPRLPPELLKCADRVATELIAGDSQYSLHFADPDIAWPNLSRFVKGHLEAESCFSSLAIGLQGLCANSIPNDKVWSSAAWDRGFQHVEMLDAKIETAIKWGAEKFFVAATQQQEAQSPDQLEILALRADAQLTAVAALADYFAAGWVEPDCKDWVACNKYHAAVRRFNPSVAEEFYNKVLFSHIISRSRYSIRGSASVANPVSATHLVTIATHRSEAIPVIAGVLGVTHVRVLYTTGPSNLASDALNIRDRVKAVIPGCEADTAGFDYDPDSSEYPKNFVQQLRSQIEVFTNGIPDENIAFDIDRGLTMHKIALIRNVIRPTNLVVSCHHEIFEKMILHGTEQLMVWRGNDSLDVPFRPLADGQNQAADFRDDGFGHR